jgi:hypothetical protein
MTNFAGTNRTVACGAPTPAGPCMRRVIPGRSCGFHDPVSENVQPLPAAICSCDTPIVIWDEDLPAARCLRCGKRAVLGERFELSTNAVATAARKEL